MKRLIAVLLILCLCLAVLPASAGAWTSPITLYGYALYSEDSSNNMQWVSFSDTNPESLTNLGIFYRESYAAAYARGMVYGYTPAGVFWSAPAEYPMNETVHFTDFSGQMEDMAYDYTHNYMYGIAWIGQDETVPGIEYDVYALVSCNLTDGSVIIIDRLRNPKPNNDYFKVKTLAIDANGRAYVLANDDNLYSLNLSNAKLTKIGPIGYSSEYVQSMCWDFDNNRLLWARESDEGEWGLYEVSTSNGSAKYLGRIGTADTEIVGLHMIPSKEPFIFRDVKESDWFFDGVRYCYNMNLMNGMSLSTFEPMTNTSRAMVVTILYRMENQPYAVGANPFNDIRSGQWYTNAVIWAANQGIVNGTGPTTFDPDANITRQQLAAILYRYAQYKKIPCSGVMLSGFSDAGQIDDYAVDAMSWAVGQGIINGTEDAYGKYLSPQGFANRAMIATILMRFITSYAAG